MQDRQYECVDGYACDYMTGDYHYGHASDYGGRREGAAPKTIRCPTKLGIWLDSWDPASQATISCVKPGERAWAPSALASRKAPREALREAPPKVLHEAPREAPQETPHEAPHEACPLIKHAH